MITKTFPMLSRRRVETQWQYAKRTGRATKDDAVAVCCTVVNPIVQTARSSASVRTDGSLETCDRQTIRNNQRRRRSRGRVQLYRQFDVDLSSGSESESAEQSTYLFHDVCGTGEHFASCKEGPKPKDGISKVANSSRNKSTRRPIQVVISEEGSRRLIADSSTQERHVPGMSPYEEVKLRKECTECASEKITRNSSTHLIDQIEVVPVNQLFRSNGAVCYSEMERIGMVFAPIVTNRPRSIPLKYPRSRVDEVSHGKAMFDAPDHSEAGTSAVTAKMSNHEVGHNARFIDIEDEMVFRNRTQDVPPTKSRGSHACRSVHWERDSVGYPETKNTSRDESERSDEAHGSYEPPFTRDRYDTHPYHHQATESRDDRTTVTEQVVEHRYNSALPRAEAHRFIDSNSNVYYLVKESPACRARPALWNRERQDNRGGFCYGRLDPVGSTWQAPNIRLVECSRPGMNEATPTFDYDRPLTNWQFIDAPMPMYDASNVGISGIPVDVQFDPPTCHPSDHRSSIKQSNANFHGAIRSRSKSPIRLYNDPPVPRHMDGSPIKKPSAYLRNQAHYSKFGRDAAEILRYEPPYETPQVARYDSRPVQHIRVHRDLVGLRYSVS